MNASFRPLLPLLFVFLIGSISVLAMSSVLKNLRIDGNLLLAANALFLVMSIISFNIQRNGMHNKNPHVFVRTVTGAMMFKMAVCIVGVIAYVYLSGSSFNKRGVFISLFLYLVYLSTEVFVVMKMNKQRKADV